MLPRCLLISVDPGSVSGAFALFFDDGLPVVGDLPVVGKQVDAAGFADLVRSHRPEAALIENVASMPKQGIASTFRFGVGTGIIRGVIAGAGVPYDLVAPTVWKKRMGLVGKDKEAGRALAIQYYPMVAGLGRVRDHGRADALLMGRWLLQQGMQSALTPGEADTMGLGLSHPDDSILWQPANLDDDHD